MATYEKWDEVILKIDDHFGYKDKVISHLKVMILGFDSDSDGNRIQYLCYVPSYARIPYEFPTFKIDRYHQRHFRLDEKYIGDLGCFITPLNPIHKHVPAPKGERCDKCNDFIEGGVRNEGAYCCRACRENPWR